MRRRCSICDFVGEDFNFFKSRKKVCDVCLKSVYDEKQKKRIISKENKREYLKEWNLDHKELRKEYNKKYYRDNKEIIGEKMKIYYNKTKVNNPEKVKKWRGGYSSVKLRREKDPLFKLVCNLRNLIKNSLTKQGYTKKSRTYEIVGIPYSEFKFYIESKFLDNMCWENYGEWHLDHIVPASSAKCEKELILLNYYTNFQPLWAIDNIKKSNFI